MLICNFVLHNSDIRSVNRKEKNISNNKVADNGSKDNADKDTKNCGSSVVVVVICGSSFFRVRSSTFEIRLYPHS